MRETSEAIAGAVNGPLAAARRLRPGRFDVLGRLPRYTSRTTTRSGTAGDALAGLQTPTGSEHPWTGASPAGWGTRATRHVSPVQPEPMVEVTVDVAPDGGGRWHHPALCIVLVRTSPPMTCPVSPTERCRTWAGTSPFAGAAGGPDRPLGHGGCPQAGTECGNCPCTGSWQPGGPRPRTAPCPLP